jgi:DNA polymerase
MLFQEDSWGLNALVEENMTQQELSNLYKEYADQFAGNEFVFGCGCTDAKLLLIGEAPGREEVKLSRPFSGAAGKNLDEFLQIAEIVREEIYITNAIKYRLSKVSPKTGRLSNRPATRDEIVSSRVFLLKEIELISPTWVVTLGNVPLRAVMGDFTLSIGNMHGKAVYEKIGKKKLMIFPLYHPASVIYNQSLKQTCQADILKLRDIVISL